jgi:hypothetical protein
VSPGTNLCQGENSSHIKLADLYNLSLSSLKITPINNIIRYPDVKGKRKIHTLTKNKALRSAPHSSFDTILNDKSRGGILLSKVIYHIHDQNKLNLPLFLT